MGITRASGFSVGVGVVLATFAAFTGAAIAFFPLGFVVRAVLPLMAMGGLIFAWAYRGEKYPALQTLAYYGLLVLIGLSIIWPRYLYFQYAGLPGVNPFTLGTMGMLAIAVGLLGSSSSCSVAVFQQFQNGSWTSMLAVLWMVWRLFASTLGEQPFFSVVELIKEMVYVGSFFLFGLFLASYRFGPRAVVRVFVVCGLLVSFIGLYEAFVQRNPFVGFITNMGDASAPQALLAIAVEKVRAGAYRAQSTFDHPIVFAQYVAALVPLALYTVFHDRNMLMRVIGLIALPVALLAIVKSGSRSGYFSVAIAFAFAASIWWLRALIHGRFTKAIAIVAFPALLGGLVLGWLFLNELIAGRNQHEISSSMVRMLMLRDGVAALWDSPIWGFGHGLSVVKAGVVNPAGLATIDNYLLTIAVDYGYFGLLLFLSTVVAFTWRALAFAVKEDSKEASFVGACLASVLALFVTFGSLSIYQNMTMFWVMICIVLPIWAGQRLDEGKASAP